VFAKFLTKFVINKNRNPAKGFKLLQRGRKEMSCSLKESNDGFFQKDEYIKEYCIVSLRFRKGENHYFGEYKK
jgi:hypothetical protein